MRSFGRLTLPDAAGHQLLEPISHVHVNRCAGQEHFQIPSQSARVVVALGRVTRELFENDGIQRRRTLLWMCEGATIGALNTAAIVSSSLGASNNSRPVKNSQATTPSAQMSARRSVWRCLSCSGAISARA